MRQLFVHVPRGSGDEVGAIAADLEAISTVVFEGQRDGRPIDMVVAHLSNRNVEPFLERIESLSDVHVSFYPSGILALKPPPSEAANQVTDIQPLSPIEVFLAGHQSVGSWRGFLGYAAAAGAVAWVGLYIGSTYLLTAAMLVAPFAGPAMNAAIATASGEGILLRRSIIRYFAALLVTVATTCVLTWLIGPEAPSSRMILESQVSSIAVVLPLVAGAAGALFLQTSERSSLVSGAAVGLLVAASLAPPAGLVGMATALGRWDMVGGASFVLALQLVGIHLSGAIVFRLFGLTHNRVRHGTGRRLLFPVGLATTAVLLIGLLTVQFMDPIKLNRTTLAQDVAVAIKSELTSASAEAEHVTTQFLQTPSQEPPVLLTEVFVRASSAASPEAATEELVERIRTRIEADWPEIEPLIDVRWVRGK